MAKLFFLITFMNYLPGTRRYILFSASDLGRNVLFITLEFRGLSGDPISTQISYILTSNISVVCQQINRPMIIVEDLLYDFGFNVHYAAK